MSGGVLASVIPPFMVGIPTHGPLCGAEMAEGDKDAGGWGWSRVRGGSGWEETSQGGGCPREATSSTDC